MPTIKSISVGTSLDLSGWSKGLNTAADQVDSFLKSTGSKLKSVPIAAAPAVGGSASSQLGGMGDQADQLAASILPLASKIQSSIASAMAPLNSFAARFAAQFDKVGGTIVAISHRIDSHLKFPTFQKGIEEARAVIQAKFGQMEGYAGKFAAAADRALGGVQLASKAKNFLGSLGGLRSDIGKIKAPDINFTGATTSVGKLTGAANVAARSFKGLGVEVALALGAFGLVFKAVGFIKDGVAGASNLNETVSKTRAVLGDASGAVESFADDMAGKFGLVKQVTLDAASGFGGLGKGLGALKGDKLAGFTTQFTKLAADLSSFKNIEFGEASKALMVGLSGNQSDTLKELGVVLTEATVKQYAYANGLAKAGSELTEQQKLQARSALIMNGLADAQGDLEKTIGGPANQFRKLTGTLTNLGASIGAMLLPALSKGLALVSEFAESAGAFFESNKATIEGWGAALGDTFDTVGTLFRNWQDVAEIAGLKIAEVVLNVGEYFATLGPNIATIAKYIGDNWYQLITDGVNASLASLKNFGKNLWSLAEAVGKFLKDPSGGFKVEWTPLLDGFKATAAKLPELLKPNLTDMSKEIQAVQDRIVGGEMARTAKKPGSAANQVKAMAGNAGNPADAKHAEDLQKFVDKLLEKALTPLEEYSAGVKQLQEAISKGLISQDQFNKGTDKLLQELPVGKFAKKLTEETVTPLEKYRRSLAAASKAFDLGLIDRKTLNRSTAFAAKDAGIDTKPKFAGAVELGSSEAYSSILAATTGRTNGFEDLERINRDQLGALNTSNGTLGRIERALNAKPQALVI